MSTDISTPSPKASRGRQPRSTRSPSNFAESEATPSKATDRRHKDNGQQQHGRHPAVAYQQEEGPSSQTDIEAIQTGDFRQGNVTDGGIVSDGLQSARRRRPPKGQRAQRPSGQLNGDNIPISPPRTSQTIPGETGATPAAKSVAYAGPTFHASPAPSALPVPKFFSKSVPGEASEAGMQARLDSEASRVISPTVERPTSSIPPRNEESPLDFIFNADRAERAKRSSGVLTPNGKLERVDSYDSSSGGASKHHLRQPSTGSGRGMFPIEMDSNDVGASGTKVPPSPMDHFRPNSMHAPTTHPRTRASMQNNDNVNRALKDMLFSLPKPANTPPAGTSDFSRQTPSPFCRPGPGSRSSSGPVTPVQAAPANSDPSSFHYGNRNLSPLFKAAKGDSAPKPSYLRQEVPSPQHARFPSHPNFNGPISPIQARHVQRLPSGPPLPYAYPQSPVNDRPYSQGQYFPSGAPTRNGNSPASIHIPSHQQSASSKPNSPATVRSQADVQSMENDLRRLLKLNIMPNGVSNATNSR